MSFSRGSSQSRDETQVSCIAGDTRDMGLIPESRGSAGGGHGNPLQYSCMENPMDRGAGGLQSRGHKELDMTEATDCACEMKTVPTERHRSGG